VKEIVKELLPPDDQGRPLSPLTRWRIVVFGTCVGMLSFMFWALSPAGFALADDFKDLRGQVEDMRLGQIEQQIYDAKQSECLSKDQYSNRFFADRVMKLAREYRQLAKGDVRIPPCAGGSDQ
jgi:hypothetical protein